MPEEKEKKKRQNNLFSKSVERVNGLISNLYGSAYNTSDENKKLVKSISTDMDRAIRNLTANSNEVNGSMLSRTMDKIIADSNDPDFTKQVESIFSENNKAVASLLDVYVNNKHIYELDREIDTICLYMPILLDALEEKQNNVLSGDIFTRDYINLANTTAEYKDDEYGAKMRRIKDMYNLTEIVDRIDLDTCKYGEAFIYVMPYVKEFKKMLQESTEQEDIITESFKMENTPMLKDNGKYESSEIKIELELSKSTIPRSILEESSNTDIYRGIGSANDLLNKHLGKKVRTLDNNLDNAGSDGLIDSEPKLKSNMDDVKGCVVKQIPREKVIPLYIEDKCLGFYLIEGDDNANLLEHAGKNMSNPMDNLTKGIGTLDNKKEPSVEPLIQQLADKLSEKISSTFVNSNTDITKELYLLLKYKYDNKQLKDNGKIRVTYIEPDYMIHWYYKKDQKTNRGVSDLYRSLFPAKFYICMSIGVWMGILTRSQDKRAYYVKQRVDTNISKLLMNTIKHIKMGNFGMREINNINTILNIQGKFHDHIIPTSESGEKPIEFEVLEGQRIEEYSDTLEKIKMAAIGPTKVPLEQLEERERVDFATELNINNLRFVTSCKKRQLPVQKNIGNLLSRIFNYEYKNETYLRVVVTLPPPKAQKLGTLTEIIRSVDDIVNKIMEMSYSRDDENKIEYQIMKNKLYRQYLSTYIDLDNIDKLKEQAKIESKLLEDKDNEDDSSVGRGW